MLHDLFVNMLIFISFICLGSQLLRKHDINQGSPLRIKVVFGLVTGLLGITLMLFTVHIDSTTIFDFRSMAIIIAAYFGGTIPVIICGLIIGLFRIVFFDISLSSVFAVVSLFIIIIGSIIIARTNLKSHIKQIFLVLYNLIISSLVFMVLLRGKTDLNSFLLLLWISTIIISIISFNYVNFCLEANLSYRKLKTESTKDYLTGLNNVRQFDILFNSTVNYAIRKNESISLLMIDIDFFKKVNDTYGHANGDKVLIDLGVILTEGCRSYDIVSRNGGEEFTIVLIDCEKDEAIKIAEKIRSGVELRDFELLNHKKINLTISIGVASFPESTNNYEKLLEMSDMALYNAKRSGRNRVCAV